MKLIKVSIQIISFILPWPLRRWVLKNSLGFGIHRNARIGFSLILAEKVVLQNGAKIQNFTFINSIDIIELSPFAKIGNLNWITGASTQISAYQATPERQCVFRLREHTRITDRHYFDCNGGITIGPFTTIAGLRSQFISHGINIVDNQQEAHSITIGAYCMVGSGVKVLKNSKLPNCSVLAAGSILNKSFDEPHGVYAGIPSRRVKDLPKEAKYFHRLEGPVK